MQKNDEKENDKKENKVDKINRPLKYLTLSLLSMVVATIIIRSKE